jgi:uncharacterized RmlC-like cupin family protein
MTASESIRKGTTSEPHEAEARVVKPLQFDGDTPQTDGMNRLAAVSGLLVGSEKLWAGVMLAEPNTASGVHHHGPQETVVYVAEGRGRLRWGRRLEHETELEPGDFLFVPAYVPHQEINPSADQPALWIFVRSGPEAVVIPLTLGADGESGSTDSEAATRRSRRSAAARTEEDRTENNQAGRPSLAWVALLAVWALGVLLGAVFGDLWLWHAGRGWPVLLSAVLLALVGVLGILWAYRARTVRRLAVLNAYAQREIARSRSRQDS